MSHNQLPSLNWEAVIADAAERLEWVAGQTSDPDMQSALLPQAGSGEAVEAIPLPASVTRERLRSISAERLSRTLGHLKDGRWAGREAGKPVGTFSPADITPQEAAGVLVVVRAYVRRHSSPLSRYPLSAEGQDDTVSRIVHAIWTRDYAMSNLGSGNLAGAVWQACSLYKTTAWVGESALSKADSRRGKKNAGEVDEWTTRGGIDNPARIAMAIEAATLGLSAPVVLNRGRGRVANRDRKRKTMPPVSAAEAREALIG
jgi:hypothetical protein